MIYHVTGDQTNYAPTTVNIRCPSCRHIGAFNGFPNLVDVTWPESGRKELRGAAAFTPMIRAGLRRCPNSSCNALVFIAGRAGEKPTVYPAETIDFDASNLPPNILSSLEEAIKCNAAGAYRASALMVRRVLEELCSDKNAAGKDLKQRIIALSSVSVVPNELLSAADELRILGNDAAHIEAREYDTIGKEESELALDLAKELLKAVYQYSSLLERLRALKKVPL